ncbi:arginyltransferase [Vibrio algarum]|uniref:Aspartate/glutamate leucyltransferase n=1 Tax=Vibrio algarum TaxID=3020714 RepID=A0ABT4YQ20_9VIBR|nr:arginyltransferase [Vibrio sp. KJ40-1]MDB1123603.1 arginyltransferase [Vibrio sp. KJ40-1]
MSANARQIKIGLSGQNHCSYLEDRMERVAVALEEDLHTETDYEMLLANGFRRSGNTIYTPYCESCNACQAIRISIPDVILTKSQKRLKNKARTLTWCMKSEMDDNWFEIYSRYIAKRHINGSMYPPKKDTFAQFAQCDWLNTQYLHIYDDKNLIAIAVTDDMHHSSSAFYTFFDPDYPLSLGTVGVLMQIEHCMQTNKQWLYLGYQIDECPAMNYKVRFHRHQKLVNQRWQG